MAQAYWAEGIAGTAVFESVFREFPGAMKTPTPRYPLRGLGARDRKGCGVFPGGSGRS